MNRPNSQIYSDYTDEDFRVWKILFDRQMDILSQTVSRNYLDALKIVNFRNDKIPDFNEVNSTLNDLTGWNLHVVPNKNKQKEFFRLHIEIAKARELLPQQQV